MAEPRLEARPNDQPGGGWCVYVYWPSGQSETVTGFLNQYHALKWIKHDAPNWIADKIMRGEDML